MEKPDTNTKNLLISSRKSMEDNLVNTLVVLPIPENNTIIIRSLGAINRSVGTPVETDVNRINSPSNRAATIPTMDPNKYTMRFLT